MSKSIVVAAIALILLGLIPLVPKIVAFRTRVLRFMHLNWFANWHERHAPAIVIVLRSIFVVLALYLLMLALS